MALENIIASWPLSNLGDISGKSHTLSVSSGTASFTITSPDSSTKVWACTGSQYLKATGITISKTSSISIWSKTSVDTRMLWGFTNSSKENLGLFCNGVYALNINGNGVTNFFANVKGEKVVPPRDDQWHLVAVTFSSGPNGVAKLYLDGVYSGYARFNIDNTLSSGTFYIGNWPSGTANMWRGSLCDARIYNKILSSDEVLSLYQEKAQPYSLTGATGKDNPAPLVYTNTLATTATSGLHKFTGKNTFKVQNSKGVDLSSTGLTEEGFCKRTYSTTHLSEDKTSFYYNTVKYWVESGAAVTIQNNLITNNGETTLSGLGVGGSIYADHIYNAVWNDMVDCIAVPKSTVLEYGRCYVLNKGGYTFSSKYLDDGIIGIHSDTAGFYVGNSNAFCLEIAIAGFTLAYVDKEYKSGTPLTCGENGTLTEIREEDIEKNPHKIVGTFWKKEWGSWWGFNNPRSINHIVETNGRMWIKVR